MRKHWLIRCGFVVLFAGLLAVAQSDRPAAGSAKRWYKGNLHTHTLNSDGDSTPHEVASWYRAHQYNFLVLTDHNFFTDVAGLNSVHGAAGKFLLIPGEEVTDRFEKKPIHINAFNPSRLIQPQGGAGVTATIQNNVDEIRRANAMPSLNHPNFHWAVTAEDLMSVKGLGLFEVYNGHPTVNNHGGGGFASLDEMWDALLTAGRRINGIAVDDAHVFKQFGKEFSNPGHGWVEVYADDLSTGAILSAIAAGDFYASTGVKLAGITRGASEYKIDIDQYSWEKITTYFIGDNGKVLAKSFDRQPAYRYTGTEKYVRARVESSSGAKAWTQPAFR